jgi:hypothetical protein
MFLRFRAKNLAVVHYLCTTVERTGLQLDHAAAAAAAAALHAITAMAWTSEHPTNQKQASHNWNKRHPDFNSESE